MSLLLGPVRLTDALWFPDPNQVRSTSHQGLVAVGGDLSVDRLLLAYERGIFPWTVRPITWWSPDPRGILEWDRFHISRSLARTIRRGSFRVTVDQAFPEVVEACSQPAPGRERSWVTREFVEAYGALHRAGAAHSVECWVGEQLVGGIYGVAIGGLFAGESMFHRVSDASKVALVFLKERLQSRGYVLFDVQMVTALTEQMGASWISRREYLQRLAVAVKSTCQF